MHLIWHFNPLWRNIHVIKIFFFNCPNPPYSSYFNNLKYSLTLSIAGVARLFFWRAKFHWNIVLRASKKILPYFFLPKDVSWCKFRVFSYINSLVVHPKFDTGAAENLWRTACGPRAALWPPLFYSMSYNPTLSSNITWRKGVSG